MLTELIKVFNHVETADYTGRAKNQDRRYWLTLHNQN